jgi:hypothetical protein
MIDDCLILDAGCWILDAGFMKGQRLMVKGVSGPPRTLSLFSFHFSPPPYKPIIFTKVTLTMTDVAGLARKKIFDARD